jgi:hypothetical protein
MNKAIISIVGASTLLAVTGGSLQAQSVTAVAPPRPPSANQTTQAPYTSISPDRSAAESRPLFYIGQLPVVVWAPVQAPYNSKANGTFAANWPWEPGAY